MINHFLINDKKKKHQLKKIMKIKQISHLKDSYIMELFGILADGEVVDSCELTNENGMQLKIINYGATATSLKIPLKNGKIVDVVLGFDTLDAYLKSFDLENPRVLGFHTQYVL